ncbi:deoxyribonuclease IV [Chlamydia caviae]|uniref:Probable endonuclease 4 n=1 Tax=Chlamydia caviae (strain ATCC VR-813 / DSM 19441 / 03DC25 / GPIC) TaxID=227941 RepID=END4_CHLCV|nr:deoxyribonuclease IV [Chlamydia caviae]Q824X6.1 RecName: Full=Probable endonuclease 4; AltName: Full=Endodeoxyribonuclease IV; AltName: Full=Endonuclease IV [Chlamydia caviae GPIC]AAP04765.1 endonuclease IV [Chlamydia caviae GPIC]
MQVFPPPQVPLLGAHTSTAGGLHNAIYEGQEIGASTIQMFTANQRQWRRRPLTDSLINSFKTALKETSLSYIMSHAGYLINPGSPNPEILEKSRICIQQEIQDCISLGINFVNFHPGAAVNDTKETCLDRIISSFSLMEPLFENSPPLVVLFETTAGQGTLVGSNFEELSYLIDNLNHKIPVGVCIDTCHIFAAGYDITSPESWKRVLKNFDDVIGLSYLRAFHLNDSMFPLGQHKDRHAPLGEGDIGIESFKFLMTNEDTRMIPKYLETPGGPDLWAKEIRQLQSFQK